MGIAGSWAGKRVVVCGGTSGLGGHLVRAAARQGADVVIIGRDLARIELAVSSAKENGAKSAIGFSADLSNFGTLDWPLSPLGLWLRDNDVDLLINAIGRSDRGALSMLAAADINRMIHDNVICTFNMVSAALESVQRVEGCIVNIGSLAGLVSAPNMGGYNIAKSALTAMTRQWRLELSKKNVHVMLVCPGPIARDDSGTRYRDLASSRGLEDAAAVSPGGGVKLNLIDPVVLSDAILARAHSRTREFVYPSKAKWLAALSDGWPWLADLVLRRYLKQK